MRIYLFLFSILILTGLGNSYAQMDEATFDRLDKLMLAEKDAELRQELYKLMPQTPKTDSIAWAQIYDMLGDTYFGEQNYGKAIIEYEKLFDLPVPQEKEYALQYAKAINDLGISYYKVGELEKAKQTHFKSIKIYRKFNDDQGLAYNHNNLGIIYKEQKQLDSAIYQFDKSRQSAEAIQDTLGVGYNLLSMAGLYNDNYDWLKALKNFKEAEAVFASVGNERMVQTTQQRIARLYLTAGDIKLAYNVFHALENKLVEQGKPADLANFYYGFAQVYLDTKQFDSAFVQLEKARSIAEPLKNASLLVRVYSSLGKVYYLQRKTSEAKYILNKSLQLAEGNFKGTASIVQLRLAQIYLDEKNYTKAEQLANDAWNATDGNLKPGYLETYYRIKQLLAEHNNNFEEAYSFQQKFLDLRSENFNQEKSIELARLEYKNYLNRLEEESNREQAKLSQEKEEEVSARKELTFYAAIIISFLVMLLAGLFYIIRLRKQKSLIISQQNKELQHKTRQLEEKNFILKELQEREREQQQEEKAQLQENIDEKERELASLALLGIENNKALDQVQQQLLPIMEKASAEVKPQLYQLRQYIQNSQRKEDSWAAFAVQFEKVHPQFFKQLKDQYPELTPNDLKILAYLRIGLNYKEIATITNIEPASVKRNGIRIRKKLNLEAQQTLRDFILGYE